MLFTVSVVSVLFLSGCGATRTVPIPDFGEIPNLAGKTSEEMTAKFGEPNRHYSGEKNTLIAEYRWPASSKKALNALAAFGTFGISSGDNSGYVDMLRCWLRKNIVLSCMRIDDMINVNIPGLGEVNNQVPLSIPNESRQNKITEKSLASNLIESPVAVAKTISKNTSVASTTKPGGKITSSKKTFSNKKVKTIRTKILAGTEISGMEIVQKKGNDIKLKTSAGAEIKVVLKQFKNDTIVLLKTTENPNEDKDFAKIYASCK